MTLPKPGDLIHYTPLVANPHHALVGLVLQHFDDISKCGCFSRYEIHRGEPGVTIHWSNHDRVTEWTYEALKREMEIGNLRIASSAE